MIDFITQISGPMFLLYFALFSGAIIFLTWYLVRVAGGYSEPDARELDMYDLALLRGREPAVLETAIFQLWNKGLIDIKTKGKKHESTIKQKKKGETVDNPIEHAIYTSAKNSLLYSELKEKSWKEKIQKILKSKYENLQERGLIPTESDRKRNTIIIAISMLLVYGIGFLKLGLGISRDKPVILLLVLLIVLLLVFRKLFLKKSGNRNTFHGRKFFKKMQKKFDWVKSEKVDAYNENDLSYDWLLGVALFGVIEMNTPLAATEIGYSAASNAAMYGGCSGDSYHSGGCSDGGGGGCGGGGCGGGCGGCGGCGG